MAERTHSIGASSPLRALNKSQGPQKATYVAVKLGGGCLRKHTWRRGYLNTSPFFPNRQRVKVPAAYGLMAFIFNNF